MVEMGRLGWWLRGWWFGMVVKLCKKKIKDDLDGGHLGWWGG